MNKEHQMQTEELEVAKEQEPRRLQIAGTYAVMGNEVRIFGDLADPLFLAKDVAGWIGHANHRKMITQADPAEIVQAFLHIAAGPAVREKEEEGKKGKNVVCLFLTELGVYDILRTSRKPAARELRQGIKKLLRNLRGGESREALLTGLPAMIDSAFLQTLADRMRALEDKLEGDRPKVAYFDALVSRKLLTNFRDTAKELRVPERAFVNWLLAQQFIYRNAKGVLRPYARAMENNLFELKEWCNSETGRFGIETLITTKGRETFRILLTQPGVREQLSASA
jgi:phage antirepressor YoqD-like protein